MQVKQSRFTILLLAIIAVGIVILVGSTILWRHQETATAKLRAEYNNKERELTGIKRDLENRELEEERLRSLETQLADLDRNLADYKYMPTYLQQMQVTARRTKNFIRMIRPADVKPLEFAKSPFKAINQPAPPAEGAQQANAAAESSTMKQYQVQRIDLSVMGSYVSVIDLLNEFRKFRKMIYVRTVDLNPERGHDGMYSVSANFETYAIITPDQYKIQETPDEKPAEVKP